MAEKTVRGFRFDCQNCRAIRYVDIRASLRDFQVYTVRCLSCGMDTGIEIRMTIRETLFGPKPEEDGGAIQDPAALDRLGVGSDFEVAEPEEVKQND